MTGYQATSGYITHSVAHLLVFGDRVQQLGVQLGVVLGQRLVAVVIDELHHRQEGERLREAVPPLSVVNLYQLVVPPFPAGGDKRGKIEVMEMHVHFLKEIIPK